MIPINDESLLPSFVFANTPRSLWEAYRKNPEVLRLSREASPEELVRMVVDLPSVADRGLADVARCYAAVAALSHLPYPTFRSNVDRLADVPVKWWRSFLHIALETTQPLVKMSFDVAPTPTIRLSPADLLPGSNTTKLIFEG